MSGSLIVITLTFLILIIFTRSEEIEGNWHQCRRCLLKCFEHKIIFYLDKDLKETVLAGHSGMKTQ